jgi:hypothetical protein
MPARKPPHHRVNDALTSTPDARSKHMRLIPVAVSKVVGIDPNPKETSKLDDRNALQACQDMSDRVCIALSDRMSVGG